MLRVTKTARKRKSRRKSARIKDLISDALTLGVHRNHLYMVLTGRRKSTSLTIRYDALQSTKANS